MKPIYTFADCELDVRKHVLYRAGIEISLEPKVFQVLIYLLEHRDRVVGKEELLEQCWPDTFVSEWALSRCLSKIRKALQPDRQGVPVIKTVHGQGYRFVAEVAAFDPSQPPRLGQDTVIETVPRSPSAPAQPLQSQTLPAVGRPTKAEWRQLTVLHVGFVDAAPLRNQLDAEDLHALQQNAHDACTEVIERFAGFVAQYLTDGMVGYFGYPQAHDDDAQRAVRAGLELCTTLSALQPTVTSAPAISLAARVGIHTGQVVVGGANARTPQVSLAVGDAPTVAASLQMLAQPNTVLISGETARLTEGFFVWQMQGDHILPDLGESMLIFQVQRPSSARTRIDAAGPQGLTAFVGRESELALLQNRWAQVQEGLGQVVLISGEAGIGKSRLLQVFKDGLDRTTHTLLEAQCVAFFQNSALHPVTQLLPRMLHWENDSLSVKLDKLERALQTCGLSVAETAPLLTSLLSLPVPPGTYAPLSASPQIQRQRTFNALVAMLQNAASHRPAVLVVEDLHWADPSTLEWLDMLLDQVAVCKLLLVLTCRPSFDPPWGLRSYLTPVALNRLRRHQVEVMIAHLLGSDRLPADLVQPLVDKTDGVPLYVEELTKTVLASGQVKGGIYRLKGELPKSIFELERAYQLARTGKFNPYAAVLLGNVYALSGRVTEALALLEEARQLPDLLVSNLSVETYLLSGRVGEARDLAWQVLEFNRGRNRRGHQAVALWLLGDIALHRDVLEIDQAEAYYQQALGLAEELGMRPLQAHCYRGLGAVYRRTGRLAQARAGLSKALEMYREMEMTFWLPETETALVQLERE